MSRGDLLVIAIAGNEPFALERLAAELPAGRNMAYVLALAPPAGRTLDRERIQGLTPLPVANVHDGQALEKDHIYLVVADQLVTFSEGQLSVS